MITRVKFDQFTAFTSLEIPFSPGLNVFVGENGTGKTHVLKTLYASCSVVNRQGNLAKEISEVFLPLNLQIGRLVRRVKGSRSGSFKVFRQSSGGTDIFLGLKLSNHDIEPDNERVIGQKKKWFDQKVEAVYIPVKDMLANASGFRSLYTERKIQFEKIYCDIIDKAFMPILKGPLDSQRRDLLTILQDAIDGKVVTSGEDFFLRNAHGNLEFTLLAEGFRKLGLLWLLIQNGVLQNGSILFWDEPETNLNPKVMGTLIETLLCIQRMGVQVFIATHDYVILKELDLRLQAEDSVAYHCLFRNGNNGEIEVNTVGNYTDVSPNMIEDTFGSIFDREIHRPFKG